MTQKNARGKIEMQQQLQHDRHQFQHQLHFGILGAGSEESRGAPQKLQQQQQRALGKNSKNFYKNSLRRIMTGFRNLIGQWLPMQFENTLWSRLTVVIWRRAGTQSNAAQDLLFCAATKRGKWCTGFGLRRLEMRSPSNMHCSGCTNKQLMLFVNFCGWWPFIMEGDKTLLTSQCTAIASYAVIVNFLEIGSDKSNGWG